MCLPGVEGVGPSGPSPRVSRGPVGVSQVGATRWRGARRRAAGRGWQTGQKNDERFMKVTRRIGVPQREQGSPSRP